LFVSLFRPNDVWIGNKKIAGLLIDLESNGNELIAACGVGVNKQTK
jgi:biotin-(acetyl-CoA carboxylase) ligase